MHRNGFGNILSLKLCMEGCCRLLSLRNGSSACVRMKVGMNEWFERNVEVHESYVMSPWLFHVFFFYRSDTT